MSSRPVRVLDPLPNTPNYSMVYRTCRDCLMEVSWPMKQTSLDHCPYCAAPYRTPTRRQLVGSMLAHAVLTLVTCGVIILAVAMLVHLGKRLFL